MYSSANNFCSTDRTFSRYMTAETVRQYTTRTPFAKNLSDSDSDSDDGTEVSSTSMKGQKIYRSNAARSKNQRQKNRTYPHFKSEHDSLLTKDTKILPNRGSSFSLKNLILSFCCMR